MPVAKPLHAETERKLLVGSRLHAGHEARALALAAIRETFEETGIVVGAKAQVAGSWGAYLLFVRFTRATGSSTAIAKFCSTDGSTLRLLTDVADFHFSDIPVRGRRWSSGDRSERATGSTPPTPLIESRVDWFGYAVLSLPNFRLPRSWTLSLSAAAPPNEAKQGDCEPIALTQASSAASPNPKDVYASAIGSCRDSTMMQFSKPSNSDFWRSFSM
jgi:8-oxo-dGTP pyrophosphatase MutT (NUDIX family)